MPAKVKAKPSRRAPAVKLEPPENLDPPLLCSPELRRQLLRALGERIDGHVRFMCKADALIGVSSEAKDRALAYFHERLAFMEKELARITENLQLE